MFPWEKEQVNHSSNGFDVKSTHAGQKRAYGDSFYEFTVKSDKSEEEVKQYCKEHVRACDLATADYLANERAGGSAEEHFRNHYEFKKRGENEYFYRVTSPSTN